MSQLLLEVDDGVAVLTLNRPESANSWSTELHVDYLRTLRELAHDPDVRAVVLTGNGRHFCVGADISLLDAVRNGQSLPPELNSESFLEPIDFPKPLIAAVNGSAAGIGLIEALLCDVRFAAETAVFTTSFAHRGLVAEHGMSWLLPQIVGRGHALDLLLSARRVSAAEAERIGLIHRAVPIESLLTTAVDYARMLARDCSPASMALIKQQVTRHSTVQLMEAERQTIPLVDGSLVGADFWEGVESFVERRPAAFAPLGQGTELPEQDAAVDADAIASRFFAATSANDWGAAHAMLSPRVIVGTYPGPALSGIEGVVEKWQRLRAVTGPWSYVDVRRIVSERAFCEQHRVVFPELGVDLEACVVARLDDQGRITMLEEYVDGAALREAIKARRAGGA